MHYHEAAAFLFDLRRFSVKPGTERVAALLDQVGNPEEDVSFVQVAGSNGKGSTARMTESILREAGLSVGLYTSPHLSALADRVRVDGLAMTEAAIADFVEEVKPWLVERAANGEPLTFFEVVTAMAIHDFARREVDVAVLEVGRRRRVRRHQRGRPRRDRGHQRLARTHRGPRRHDRGRSPAPKRGSPTRAFLSSPPVRARPCRSFARSPTTRAPRSRRSRGRVAVAGTARPTTRPSPSPTRAA